MSISAKTPRATELSRPILTKDNDVDSVTDISDISDVFPEPEVPTPSKNRPSWVGAFVLLALLERPLLDLAKSKGVGRSVLQPASALSLIFLLVGGIWLFYRVIRKRKTGFSHLDLACGVLAGASVLSLASSPSRSSTIEFSIRFTAALGMYIVLRRLLWDKRVRPSWLLYALGGAVGLVVLYIIVGGAIGLNVLDSNRGTLRLAGPFLQSNTLAHFLLPHVVMGFAMIKHLNGRWRIVVAALTAAAAVSLMLTLTISAWIGLAIAVGIIALIQSRWLLIAMPVAGIAFLLLVPSALDRVTEIEPDPDKPRTESSLVWRLEYWGEISSLNSSNPVTGVGLGGVKLLTPQEKEPHNDYLRAFVEMGIIGLAGYLALISGMLTLGWRAMKRTKTGVHRGLAVGFFAYSAGFALVSAAENLVIAVVTMWYVLAYAALTEYVSYHPRSNPLEAIDIPFISSSNIDFDRFKNVGETQEVSIKVRTILVLTMFAFLGLIGIDRTPTRATVLLAAPFEGIEVEAGTEWPTYGTSIDDVLATPDESLAASTVDQLAIRWKVPVGGSSFTTPAVVTVDEVPTVFVGDQRGYLTAFDANVGERLWSSDLGGNVSSAPVVHEGIVYVGTSRGQLHAVDAVTGASICATDTTGNVQSAPLVVDPDGAGPAETMVYFGDSASGGDLYAARTPTGNSLTDCAVSWVFGGFASPAGRAPGGVAASPTIGWTPSGRPIIIAGSSGPGGQVHGVDALTGDERWRFRISAIAGSGGVSAPAAISPPSNNDFDDGVVYVTSENRTVYALDLVTGSLIWEFAIGEDSPEAFGSMRAKPALVRNRLYVGYGHGIYALNATTGASIWRSESFAPRTDDIVGSPVVAGPRLDRVILAADVAGMVHAFDTASGQRLWSHEYDGPVRGGLTVVDGRIFVVDGDGFLSRFDLDAQPISAFSTIESPADGANPPNPDGQLFVSGEASSAQGVATVTIAVRDDVTGSWWNDSAREWGVEYADWQAVLNDAGGRETEWTADFPVLAAGGNYGVVARTVNGQGQVQSEPTESRFFVPSQGGRPDTVIQTPIVGEFFVLEDTGQPMLTITGVASDRRGPRPGIARVMVTVTNLEQQTYYCDTTFCGRAENEPGRWTTSFARLSAELSDPGDESTVWTVTVPVDEKAFSYRIDALSIDNDGERDLTPARVDQVCFLDPRDRVCSQ